MLLYLSNIVTMEVVEKSQVYENGEIADRFAAFVVLDFETNDLPEWNFNKLSLTEISMYGFLKKHFVHVDKRNVEIPKPPRALQKLTIVVNPRAVIQPMPEKLSGLNNYLLEECIPFNKNTAELVERFIKQLPSPVCLVAQNGFRFDFPILRAALAKYNVELPEETLCIDSVHAFNIIEREAVVSNNVKSEENVNWQETNETTPKRARTLASNAVPRKGTQENSAGSSTSRRNLFPDTRSTENNEAALDRMRNRFEFSSPRGYFKLGNIYERAFGSVPDVQHFAEGDVETLMRLMFYYGNDFLNYAETWAVAFAEIPTKFKITN